MLVMGCDGGTLNFGVSVIEIGNCIRPVYSTLLTATINNATNKESVTKWRKDVGMAVPPFDESSRIFQENIRNIVQKFPPDFVTAERFQTRGFGGPTIEHISLMNAFIFAETGSARRVLIPAAEWKARVNAWYPLESIYMEATEIGLTHHHVDSSLIGLYGAQGDFPWLSNGTHVKAYVAALQRATR